MNEPKDLMRDYFAVMLEGSDIDITIDWYRESAIVTLDLEEAKEVRNKLNEFIDYLEVVK